MMAWMAMEEAVGEVWHSEEGTGRRKWSVRRVGDGGEGALEWLGREERSGMARI